MTDSAGARSGVAISWESAQGILEVELHHAPANEIGTVLLGELEALVDELPTLERDHHAMILTSREAAGFSAGADLRELYSGMLSLAPAERGREVRTFLERVHAAFDRLDSSRLVTIAATHGVVFGGGFELALTCDLIIADRMTRFAFPELRLGLVPGFGGIPRLSRDLGNAIVRDLLLTGRSLGARRAHEVGLVSQLVAEGQALAAARSTATQIGKFDAATAAAAKRFAKPIPREALQREIEIFLELFSRPQVEEALRRFVESDDPMPYLPSAARATAGDPPFPRGRP